MRFECPKCKRIGITKSFLNSGDNLSCNYCNTRYSYKEKYPWLFNVIHLIVTPISIIVGLTFSSWLVFFVVYFGLHFFAHHIHPNKKRLVDTEIRTKQDI